jgi:hypothetical protein
MLKVDQNSFNPSMGSVVAQKSPPSNVLDTLNSSNRTIHQIIENAKRTSLYLDAEVSVARQLLRVDGTTPADKETIQELRAHVLATLLTGISTKISLLTFTKESAFSECRDDFARQARETIAKIKKAIAVYFSLAAKTYGPDYQSPSKTESRWDTTIASVEHMLPKKRTIFDWLSDLFTPDPIKITVGAAGARTGPMPHYQTVYVGGTTSKQFFMG